GFSIVPSSRTESVTPVAATGATVRASPPTSSSEAVIASSVRRTWGSGSAPGATDPPSASSSPTRSENSDDKGVGPVPGPGGPLAASVIDCSPSRVSSVRSAPRSGLRSGRRPYADYPPRRRTPVPDRPEPTGPCGSGRRTSHRSEEHTSELQSRFDLVCRLLLEKKKNDTI